MVYYRKYRSQTIAQLDSPKLRETLTSVLSAKEVPHAFLFTGPKGLGKTSTARIIAKVLNCTSKKRNGIEPCNACEQCVSITNGNNIDVLEIDGASNRGIDEIRELRERVNLAPSSAKKKVYIIDEVHMLTTEAFNALLKTIEEPPAHVVFIFCTTEPQKVPATIISRCFHISLNRATDEEIMHSLRRIAEGEKITVTDEVLCSIAEMADGGFRDATKIFEELVLVANGKEVTKEIVEDSYKTTSIFHFVTELVTCLKEKNASNALGVVSQVISQGTDIRFFIYQVLSYLHKMLLDSVNNTMDKYPQNSRLSTSEIQEIASSLDGAYVSSKYSPLPQLPLEISIVKWCTENRDSSDGKIASQPLISDKKEEKVPPFNQNTKVSLSDVQKKEKNLKVQVVLGKAPAPVIVKQEAPHTQENLPENGNANSVFMENIIYKVKPYNHSVAGVLRGCTIKLIDGEKVIFETPYKFHKEKLNEIKTREILEKGVREITGKNLIVMIELKSGL